MSVRRVSVQVSFAAELPDGIDGDEWADRIADGIVAALEAHPPMYAYDESFAIRDWNDDPEPAD